MLHWKPDHKSSDESGVERLIPERASGHHPSLRTGYFSSPSVRAMGAGLELAARRKDGSEFPVDISLSPLETEEGLLVKNTGRDHTVVDWTRGRSQSGPTAIGTSD